MKVASIFAFDVIEESMAFRWRIGGKGTHLWIFLCNTNEILDLQVKLLIVSIHTLTHAEQSVQLLHNPMQRNQSLCVYLQNDRNGPLILCDWSVLFTIM